MATVTITIGSPVLVSPDTVHVVVRNSSGGIVRESDEDNDPFTITGLAYGDYTMEVTNGTNVTTECFTIEPCGCPDIVSVDIEQRGTSGLYDLVFVFDMTLYQPTSRCGFSLFVQFGTSGGFLHPFTSLGGEFEDLGGGMYKLKRFINTSTSLTYTIYKLIDGVMTIDTAEVCYPATFVNYVCNGPLITSANIDDIYIDFDGTDYTLNIDYAACGVSCNTVVWNYLQTGVPSGMTPDSGTFATSINCSPLSGTFSAIISPAPVLGNKTYTVIGMDCCGNTYTETVVFLCKGVNFAVGNIAYRNSLVSKTTTIRVFACGEVCQDFTFFYTQINSAAGLTPDSGSIPDTVSCVSVFPLDIDYVLNPTATTSGDPRYEVWVVDCCGKRFSRVIATVLP